jgi:hypothetical protein
VTDDESTEDQSAENQPTENESTEVDQPLPQFPPDGAALPEGATLGSDGEITLATTEGVQNIGPFPFCFSVNGRPWGQQDFYAPDPDAAAVSAQQMAGVYQGLLRALGYPNVVVTVAAGPC